MLIPRSDRCPRPLLWVLLALTLAVVACGGSGGSITTAAKAGSPVEELQTATSDEPTAAPEDRADSEVAADRDVVEEAVTLGGPPTPVPTHQADVAEVAAVTATPESPLAEQSVSLPPAPIGFPSATTNVTPPLRLTIETLAVDSAITSSGVDSEGNFEVPPAELVGWYEFGPSPGEQGSTVLAAHIAFDGVDGVFRNLDRLEVGSIVMVTDAAGEERSYRTVSLERYAKEELPVDLFRRDGEEQLVLITCGGDFNPSLRSYDDNVVAIAVPA